jgi:hypothetical protein
MKVVHIKGQTIEEKKKIPMHKDPVLIGQFIRQYIDEHNAKIKKAAARNYGS